MDPTKKDKFFLLSDQSGFPRVSLLPPSQVTGCCCFQDTA